MEFIMAYDKNRVMELEAQLFEIAAKDKDLKRARKITNQEWKETYNEMMVEHHKHPFYKGLRIALFSMYGIGAAFLVGAAILNKREEDKLQRELQRAAELKAQIVASLGDTRGLGDTRPTPEQLATTPAPPTDADFEQHGW